ncbi:hypothetical protein J6590_061033 [Homalodisca vitripennis]|nr:hypothetical protein J6590_061033 [Homalodisca vitripennis]
MLEGVDEERENRINRGKKNDDVVAERNSRGAVHERRHGRNTDRQQISAITVLQRTQLKIESSSLSLVNIPTSIKFLFATDERQTSQNAKKNFESSHPIWDLLNLKI